MVMAATAAALEPVAMQETAVAAMMVVLVWYSLGSSQS